MFSNQSPSATKSPNVSSRSLNSSLPGSGSGGPGGVADALVLGLAEAGDRLADAPDEARRRGVAGRALELEDRGVRSAVTRRALQRP